MNNSGFEITREQIRSSLKGFMPKQSLALSVGEELHLNKRKLLVAEYGEKYADIVDDAVNCLPENIGYLPIDDIIRYLKIAVNCWCEGIKQLVKHKLTLMPAIKQCDVLGFKNDPPGVYPLLSTLIPNGMTSAILRDPRDTTFDFNRCYKKEDTIENIKWHCNHYNWHLNYARKQIDVFYDEIKKNYFVHDFENFITSSSHRENYLTRMCGAREKVNCYFDASKSIKNIGLYKDKDRSLVQIIEKECMEHYDSFKSFLRERELLME